MSRELFVRSMAVIGFFVSRSQVSLINFVASLCGAGGIQAFKTMRTLRALRPLRAMSRMQGMRVCSSKSQQTFFIRSFVIFKCRLHTHRSLRYWAMELLSFPHPDTTFFFFFLFVGLNGESLFFIYFRTIQLGCEKKLC